MLDNNRASRHVQRACLFGVDSREALDLIDEYVERACRGAKFLSIRPVSRGDPGVFSRTQT